MTISLTQIDFLMFHAYHNIPKIHRKLLGNAHNYLQESEYRQPAKKRMDQQKSCILSDYIGKEEKLWNRFPF